MLYKYVNPRDSSDPLFLQRLNEARERFFHSGTWKGVVQPYYFEASANATITGPWFLESMLASTIRGIPTPAYTEFHRFVPGGPGFGLPEWSNGCQFYDLGDRFPTTVEIPEGSSGVLRTTIASADDAGKQNRYYGLDASGNEIYDADGVPGESVTLAYPTTNTTNSFSKVTGVVKEQSSGRQTLACVISGTPTTLSIYQPVETIPLYRKYQIGEVNESATYGNMTIATLWRLRFIPLTSENDFVIPGNIGALKMALLALNAESAPAANMLETADAYWAKAYRLLDEQHKAANGGAIRRINMQQAWGVLPVGNSM